METLLGISGVRAGTSCAMAGAASGEVEGASGDVEAAAAVGASVGSGLSSADETMDGGMLDDRGVASAAMVGEALEAAGCGTGAGVAI
jgi:hypothetical protein